MAIDDNTKYAITGEQVKDLARRLALTQKTSVGEGAPTTSTEGNIGQLYVDTSTGDIYYLSEIVEESGEPDSYVWNQLNGESGGSDVTSYYVDKDEFMAQDPDFHIYKDIELTQMATYSEILEAYKTTGVELVFVNTGISDLPSRYNNATKCTFIGAYYDGDPNTSCFEVVSQMISPYGYDANGFYKFAIYCYNYWDGQGPEDGFSYFWQDLSRADVVQSTGNSTTAVMSQKAVTDSLNGRVKTNAGAPTSSTAGTKGQLLEDTTNGDLYICTKGTSPYTWKKIASIADLTSAIKTNAGAPTTSTVGTVGQLLEDTTNGKLYICTEVSGNTYTWEEVGAGGGGESDVYVLYIPDALPYSDSQTATVSLYTDSALTTSITREQIREITDGEKQATLVWSDPEQEPYIETYQVIATNDDWGSCYWNVMGSQKYYSFDFGSDPARITASCRITSIPNITHSTGGSMSLVMSQSSVTSAINNKITSGAGAPTTSTTGSKGQLYEDTTNGKLYICTDVSSTNPRVYTWVEVGASGLTTRVYTVSMGNSVSGQGKTFNLPAGVTAQEIYEKQQQGILTIFNFSVKNASAAFGTYTVPVTAAFDGTSYSAFGCSPSTDVKTVSFVATGTNTTGQAKIFTTRNIVGSTPPSTNTTSYTLGTLYHDTSTGKTYICTLVNESNFTSTWTEIGAGGGMSNTMVLYTNQNLPNTESSSYHLYSDLNLTTTVNTRDIYDCYKSGGNVVLIIPTSSDNPGTIYAGYVAELHQIDFDADDGVYVVSFLVKEYNTNPKLYSYSGSTGDWKGKTDFVDAVSPSTLSGMITTNAGAPTTSTAGTKGQLLEDTTNGKVYVCTDVTNPYVWKEVNTDKMVVLSYGSSTWSDFINAYNTNSVVYCRASSNANPATGSQNRMAFMAYVSDATNPTNVEFQYYRSVSSKTASQQCDQVFVYKLTNANGGTWTVETRDATSKVVAGTNMTSSYSNGTLTLNCSAPVITMQTTDPGEGSALAENHFIAVYSV